MINLKENLEFGTSKKDEAPRFIFDEISMHCTNEFGVYNQK